MPIFHDGRLVAWAAMFGHMTDVGGKVPGSLPTDAKTIFEEGIIDPADQDLPEGRAATRTCSRSCCTTAACRTGTGPTSTPSSRRCALAERRVRENVDRFGDDIYVSAMGDMLERNKRAMRAIIQMIIPEEARRTSRTTIDDDGMGIGPYKIACTMWREGDKCIFDFDGTDPQSISSINFLLTKKCSRCSSAST